MRILIPFYGMHRHRVPGSDLRSMQSHLNGHDLFEKFCSYPDELVEPQNPEISKISEPRQVEYMK